MSEDKEFWLKLTREEKEYLQEMLQGRIDASVAVAKGFGLSMETMREGSNIRIAEMIALKLEAPQ